MKLDGDLYVYLWRGMENNCNSYLIKGTVPVLIDPGHQHLVKSLINRMEKDGNKMEDIKLLIATHAHPDHFEAVQIFSRAGVYTTIHQEEEKFIMEVGREFYGAFGMEMPEYKIDFYLKEGELKLGNKTFQIFHTPGHSPGSISIYWL
ncbi:MAG: MBL fold metallo-hydrolase, partial [bacterium]